MRMFAPVAQYEEEAILPKRGTGKSAGYDLSAVEDTVVPSFWPPFFWGVQLSDLQDRKSPIELDEQARKIKELNLKPTLVPTGLKVYCEDDEYLAIVPRSSIATNHCLIIPNSPATIDADYADNESNEGHIFVPVYNFSPYDVVIKKGERFAQGIFLKYGTTDDDVESAERSGGFGSTNS